MSCQSLSWTHSVTVFHNRTLTEKIPMIHSSPKNKCLLWPGLLILRLDPGTSGKSSIIPAFILPLYVTMRSSLILLDSKVYWPSLHNIFSREQTWIPQINPVNPYCAPSFRRIQDLNSSKINNARVPHNFSKSSLFFWLVRVFFYRRPTYRLLFLITFHHLHVCSVIYVQRYQIYLNTTL